MIKEFNSLEEIKKYYDKKANTYIFKEDGEYIDLIKFNFDLNIKSNINAWNINARNIKARNIKAGDIKAGDINAGDINAGYINARNINAWDINSLSIVADTIIYFAVCFAHFYIRCISIKGRISNAKHFVLDGKIKIVK